MKNTGMSAGASGEAVATSDAPIRMGGTERSVFDNYDMTTRLWGTNVAPNSIELGLLLLMEECHHTSQRSGFWPEEGRNKGEAIALTHSELSEMLEAARTDVYKMSEKIPEFTQEEEEAADVIIRHVDYCRGFGLRLAQAVLAKMEYNLHREDHRPEVRNAPGGKKF